MRSYLWLLPFLGFAAGYCAMSLLYTTAPREVPMLIGMTVVEAARSVSEHGLTLCLVGEKNDPELPVGTVITQNPQPKSRVRERHAVCCVISKREPLRAPSLIGRTVAAIQQEIQATGVSVKYWPVAKNVPARTCIAQDTVPGAIIADKIMTVYVAKEQPAPFLIPDMRQRTIADVRALCSSRPVTLEVVHPEGTVSEDHVCNHCIVADQTPRAGTVVNLDQRNPLPIKITTAYVVDNDCCT